MSIENMFGDLDKIDILAETKTGEVVWFWSATLAPGNEKALLDKMEGLSEPPQSEEFQKEYGGLAVILRVTLDGSRMAILACSARPCGGRTTA